MKFTVTVTAKKSEGRPQDSTAVQQAIEEALEDISNVWVDDGERDGESEYEVEWGSVTEVAAKKKAGS